MATLNRWMLRIIEGQLPWWVWPSVLVLLASVSIAAAWTIAPTEDPTKLAIGAYPFGGECGMKKMLGIPCPQCGMTRSWVYLVRGRVAEAFTFNAAGALLLLWIGVGGLIGALRLATGRARLLAPPWILLFVWSMLWVALPYGGLWVARIFGVNPLPEYLG
jgi:hypothetical protein